MQADERDPFVELWAACVEVNVWFDAEGYVSFQTRYYNPDKPYGVGQPYASVREIYRMQGAVQALGQA